MNIAILYFDQIFTSYLPTPKIARTLFLKIAFYLFWTTFCLFENKSLLKLRIVSQLSIHLGLSLLLIHALYFDLNHFISSHVFIFLHLLLLLLRDLFPIWSLTFAHSFYVLLYKALHHFNILDFIILLFLNGSFLMFHYNIN